MNRLADIILPHRMRAALATDLSEIISGLGAGTVTARLAALLLLHVSWSAARPLPLRSYLETLEILQNADRGTLLDTLSDTTAFGRHHGEFACQAAEHVQHLRQLLAGGAVAPSAMVRGLLHSFSELFSTEGSHEQLLRMEILHLLDDYTRVSDLHDLPCPTPPGMRSRSEPADFAGSGVQWLGYPVLQRILQEGAQGAAPAPSSVRHGTADAGARAGASAQDDPRAAHRHGALKVYDPQDAHKALRGSSSGVPPGEGNARQRVLLESMVDANPWRDLTQLTQDEPLRELYERFPHFKEVLDFVSCSLSLAACGEEGRPVRFAPLLLRGEPGSGKTYFAQELARVLGTHFLERDLSVTTEAFVLSGLDSSWKGSKPGAVFEALVSGTSANPLICLNEVDKASTTDSRNSPLSALYALLEPTSASRFVDEFVPVPLDASRVLWVLTANDGFIPEPVLSRLEVFDIALPTATQLRAVCRSVWKSVVERSLPRGSGFSDELPEDVLQRLACLSPRVLRKALTHAAGVAAHGGRRHLTVSDLEAGARRYVPRSRGAGFLAQG